jgi:hypothetical protein
MQINPSSAQLCTLVQIAGSACVQIVIHEPEQLCVPIAQVALNPIENKAKKNKAIKKNLLSNNTPQ